MNQTAQGVRGEESQKPQDDQNDCDSE